MSTKIKFYDLEALRKGIRVSKDLIDTIDILFQIGEENIEEHGVELINKIKFLRDLSDKDICHICGIRENDLKKVLVNGKISSIMADRFTALGYPKWNFLKN